MPPSLERWCRLFVLIGVLSLLGPAPVHAAPPLSGLRLPFIANEGQVASPVAYYAPTFAGTLYVTHGGELVHALPAATTAAGWRSRPVPRPGWTLTETFRGGRPRPSAGDRSATGVSAFLGDDLTRWRAALPAYEELSLGEVWPGVTVDLRARGRSVEKVFTVYPGAPVHRIRVRVGGSQGLSLDREGALVAATALGPITFSPPVAYQEHDGVRRPVPVGYRRMGTDYGFTVGAYDRARPLVIDPILQSTYLGGGDVDQAYAMAMAPGTGDIYVAGFTGSRDFPGTAGGAQEAPNGGGDVFVARLSATLTALTQVTYFGGSDVESAYGLAISPLTGDVYVAGETASTDLPATANGAQATIGGGLFDAFVARLPATLTALTQATYLGGSDRDHAYAIAVNATSGDVYLTGFTRSPDFPATAGGAQPSSGGQTDAFVARLPASLTAFTRTTYLGGSGTDHANAIALHATTGDVYVGGDTTSFDFPGVAGSAQPILGGGQDAFVARLPSTLTSLTRATFLGGSGDELAIALGIAPSTGDVYAAGQTSSTNFQGTGGGVQPFNAGGLDGFVARLNGALTVLTQATYLGGTGDDGLFALAITPSNGDVYVAGSTDCLEFPGTVGGIQPTNAGGVDAVVARLGAALTALTHATYLGGTGDDAAFALVAAPTPGEVYVAGLTSSADFPVTAGGAQAAHGGADDAFVTRLAFGAAPTDPLIAVTPASRDFGTLAVNTTSDLTFTVQNTAGGTLTGTATAPAPYSVVSGSPFSLGANASVLVTVRFAPTFGNTFNASVSFDSNAGHLARGVTGQAQTFVDVPVGHAFWTWIEGLARSGITSGCATGPLRYCPDTGVTRAQMAVFLVRGMAFPGSANPPEATGTVFADVPQSHGLAKWVEALAAAGITSGCAQGPPRYCPDDAVTRAQMAVFLLRAKHGPSYDPPAPTVQTFADVPLDHAFAKWIYQLAAEGITSGCATSPARYCPDLAVTRGQMAVFLVRTFGLPN